MVYFGNLHNKKLLQGNYPLESTSHVRPLCPAARRHRASWLQRLSARLPCPPDAGSINTALVVALFLVTAFAYRHGFFHVAMLSQHPGARRSVAWSVAAVLSLPMLVAVYRKAMALGMLLAELAVPVAVGGEYNLHIRNALARLIDR